MTGEGTQQTGNNEKQAPSSPERLSKAEIIKNARIRVMSQARNAREEMNKKIKSKSLGLTGRGDFVESAVRELMDDPIKDALKKWEETKKLLEAQQKEEDSNENLKQFKEALDNETTSVMEKIAEAERLLEKYIEEMTRDSGGKLDAEALAALKDGNRRANNMAKLIMNGNKGIKEAVRWVLRAPNTADAGKKGAFKALVAELQKGGEMTGYAWMIIRFMNPEDKKEFTTLYVKTCTYDEAAKFMAEGNKLGTFTLEERENILKENFKDSYKELTSEQKQQFAINWKVQNVFKEEAERLVKVSYGAKNAAGEMFTFKNILFFVGQVVAATGLVANAAATFFVGGAWKKPGKALRDFLANNNVKLAAGVLGVIHAVKKTGSVTAAINTFSETGNDKQDKEKKGANRDLKNVLKVNPGWKDFLESKDHFGVAQLGEFVKSKIDSKTQKVDKNRLTLAEFTDWLQKKTKDSKGAEKDKYNSLAQRFSKTGEKYTISESQTKYPTDNTEFKMLANAFAVYQLWGAETTRRYSSATATAPKVPEKLNTKKT